MAQYHVKNGSFLAKAFKVRGGHQVVPAGKSADVLDAKELTEAQIEAFARDGVKVAVKGASKAKPEPSSGGAYVVADKGRGWFAITRDGKEVTKSLREDDVKGFDEMSDTDKAAFVDLHKPE